MATMDEQETTISFDYPTGWVRVYTTKAGLYNGAIRRLGRDNVVDVDIRKGSWSFKVPLDCTRNPLTILQVKVNEPKPKQVLGALAESIGDWYSVNFEIGKGWILYDSFSESRVKIGTTTEEARQYLERLRLESDTGQEP